MGEFAYAYFGYLKDDVLTEVPQGVFRIFVDAWYLCLFCNMDSTSEYSLLERVNNILWIVFKS